MEKITNIEINNFKSIRHAEIKDCRRVNVFIGYPNVGKSNILEALALFALNQQTRFTDLVRVKEIPTIFFNGFMEKGLMVSINGRYGVFGDFSENNFSLTYQTKNNEKIFEEFEINIALNPSVKKVMLFNGFEYLSGTNSNEQDEYFVVKKYEFKKIVNQAAKNYSSLQYPFGNNIFSILQTNEHLNTDASNLLKEYQLELLFDNREQQFTILKRTGSSIFTVPYELLADTIQRLIFYKAAIFSNKEKVLLLEEPEAHMFPPYIRKMTADIVNDKNDNQYFIATHSPYVLDELMAEAADDVSIYLVDYKDGETKIIHLSNQDFNEIREYGVNLFFNIESYLKHGQVDNA
ncbi:MAG: AAA family ATPase [Flavobacterium sp.]|nr:AAA family ATPase [Flavobacterium sp.]